MTAKQQRTGRTTSAKKVGGTRILDVEDAKRFVSAADSYATANTSSQEVARKKLRELGFIDRSGKPTKHYR